MKLGVPRLTNTELRLVRFARGGAISAEWAAKAIWPQSMHLKKKAGTIRRHLGRLERLGFVRRIGEGAGELWVLAPVPPLGLMPS